MIELEKEQLNRLVSKEFPFTMSDVVAQLFEALRHKQKGRGFDPDGVSGNFYWRNSSSHTMFDSASNGNKYQEYFQGVKSAGA